MSLAPIVTATVEATIRRGDHQNKSGQSRRLGLRHELDPEDKGETRSRFRTLAILIIGV